MVVTEKVCAWFKICQMPPPPRHNIDRCITKYDAKLSLMVIITEGVHIVHKDHNSKGSQDLWQGVNFKLCVYMNSQL